MKRVVISLLIVSILFNLVSPEESHNIEVEYPYNGDVVSGIVKIEGSASEDIQKIIFEYDSKNYTINGSTHWEFYINTSELDNGKLVVNITGVFTDDEKRLSLTVFVNNTPPRTMDLDIQLPKDKFYPDEKFFISGKSRYDSGEIASGCEVILSIDGKNITSHTDRRGYFTIEITSPKEYGIHSITITVYGKINGTWYGKIEVVPRNPPDIYIETVKFSPEKPVEGDEVSLSIIIKNEGGTGRATVICFDESMKLEIINESVQVNRSAHLSGKWMPDAGIHRVKIEIKKVEPPDSNESNHKKMLNLTVRTIPDIRITNITFSNKKPVEGQKITIKIDVENFGGKEARVIIRCRTDGNMIGERTGTVKGHSKTSFFVHWNTTSGFHTITVSVESMDGDKNLNDNEKNTEIVVEEEKKRETSPFYTHLILVIIMLLYAGRKIFER